jgi:hypothetical protein
MKKIIFFVILLFVILPTNAFAKIGVGTGKIQVEDKLKPGIIYTLPSLSVINTGDEGSYYEVGVSYHENQAELMPARNWFHFSPKKFYLDPGQAQEVKLEVNLPMKVKAGDYFAYVEGYPAKKTQLDGETSVGIAAASKLYFSVVPGSMGEALYYRLVSFWNVHTPWPQLAVIFTCIFILVRVYAKFLNIKIALKDSEDGKKKKKHNDE